MWIPIPTVVTESGTSILKVIHLKQPVEFVARRGDGAG